MRRRYFDYETFMMSEYRHHYLIVGTHRNCFDRCHGYGLVDHLDKPYPPHVLARPYLRTISYLQGGEEPSRIRDYSLFDRNPPTYFAGYTRGNLVHVDLTSAYLQLYAPASLDVSYDGASTPRNGRIKFLGACELGEHRELRNSIIGTVRSDSQSILDHGRLKHLPMSGKWQRPDLWALVQDTLEVIAWEMRLLFGAVHIHTDGYILPHPELGEAAVAYLADQWELASVVAAEGEGEVVALGSWRIGDQLSGEPEAGIGVHVDSMTHVEAAPYLRAWHLEAKAERRENPERKVEKAAGGVHPW